MQGVLGNGMVIYPKALFEEIDAVREAGVDPSGRLFVSDRAQVILPTHVALDRARESARGSRKIGTTVRGIGPAYESKAARSGVRCGDLLSSGLQDRLKAHLDMVTPQAVLLQHGSFLFHFRRYQASSYLICSLLQSFPHVTQEKNAFFRLVHLLPTKAQTTITTATIPARHRHTIEPE